MRIGICEDDITMQKRINEILNDWAQTRKIEINTKLYKDAESFLFEWPETLIDLIFLDIEMKNLTGIELAKIIRKTDKNMFIVFLTSHRQYALTGYDVNALHFLIKPPSPAKIIPILDKAYAIWNASRTSFILIPIDSGKMKLFFGDIHYISIVSHTVSFHTVSEKYEMRITMNELVNQLPSHFIRIHRSYIVNLIKVDCIFKDSLLLSNEEKLPVSRNCSKNVYDAYIKLHTVKNT